MLEQALQALATYDWGADPNLLQPIDAAIVASHGNAEARRELENRLAAHLRLDCSRDAKDYVCRKLMQIGTAFCVPLLAEQLPRQELSHMARYALERIPASEAAAALRDSLPHLSPELQVGVIASLGVRRDEESVPALAKLLSSEHAAVARAAACALGDIGTNAATTALTTLGAAAAASNPAAIDASLACAEGLLAAGNKTQALAIFKSFAGETQPKHIRLAATRGMLACSGVTQ